MGSVAAASTPLASAMNPTMSAMITMTARFDFISWDDAKPAPVIELRDVTGLARTVTVHASESAVAYVLVFVGDRSLRHVLGDQPSTIGRAEDCGLRIDDASVSRQHARLELRRGICTIEDLRSHNGTRINGVTHAGIVALRSGDVITIGEATLIVHLPSPAWTGELDAAVVERLEGEIDRASRYGRRVAIVVWSVRSTEGVGPLIPTLLRRCDAIGPLGDGLLLGVFPELDAMEATLLARRGVDLLRALDPTVRAGVAACPSDGIDAASLLAAARAGLGAAKGDVAYAEPHRFELGDNVALVADRVMVEVYDLLRRLARSDLPVLVSGETGTGKELACRALHEWSPRAKGPFVSVNCAALTESLIESELFGHRRGAFTGADRDRAGLFESAAGGTLFLDEIGELPLGAQAKLLRAVETRTVTRVGDTEPINVDVRFVAATNRDLATEVAEGRFRRDLYFRLSAAIVTLPPLRDRPREIPILARVFLECARERLQNAPSTLSDATLRHLLAHPLPGNVRELAHMIEYAATVALQDVVEPWHLPAVASRAVAQSEPSPFRPIADEVADLERRRMQEALDAADGNQSRAAELIGMPRRTFVTKLAKYQLR